MPDGSKRSIDFLCEGNYWFTPDKVFDEGVGGAEYILIHLAQALAELGHQVTIFNDTPAEKVYGDVSYRRLQSYNPLEQRDVLVIWRVSYHKPHRAKRLVFFSCDQYTDRNWEPMLPKLDRFFCISPFHRSYILRHYPMKSAQVVALTPGVRLEDYRLPVPKVRYKMIFCSVPERGLEELMAVWGQIRRRLPQASVVITSDYRLWGSKDHGAYRFLPLTKQSGVEYLGKLPRVELVQHQLTSEILAYPCNFSENFGIAVAECMAAGTVPVTFDSGALKTTVGAGGIVVPRKTRTDPDKLTNPLSSRDLEQFVDTLCDLLEDPQRLEILREHARSLAAQRFDYRTTATDFLAAL